MVMSESLDRRDGFVAALDLSFLMDKKGTAVTDLHPTGKCEFDQKTYEVISSGSFVKRGSAVRVTATEGSKVVVEEIRS